MSKIYDLLAGVHLKLYIYSSTKNVNSIKDIKDQSLQIQGLWCHCVGEVTCGPSRFPARQSTSLPDLGEEHLLSSVPIHFIHPQTQYRAFRY